MGPLRFAKRRTLRRPPSPCWRRSYRCRWRRRDNCEASAEVTSGEPSWSCLANLVEEEQFLQVWHHLASVRSNARSPVAPVAERLLPLIRNHRYAAYVEGYRYDFTIQGTEVIRSWRTIRVVDPRASMYYMLVSLGGVRDPSGKSRGEEAYSQAATDLTVHGLTEVLAGWCPSERCKGTTCRRC